MSGQMFRVSSVETAVFIAHPTRDCEALSVSGSRQVTLHCAGDLTSDPFPFDAIVYAPFHNTLYSACVADNVRAQFGAALQRPAEAAGAADGRSAPRRCTIVHGDPVAHSTAAFHNVVRLAAEDVERIAGAHHAESPYECVFNVVRVYPWGETDLLREALRGEAEALPSLWREKTTVPLRTTAHRRLLMTALQDLCRVPAAGERDESAACVAQVRLAVYASGGAGGAGARREKVLCAEHLFSLMPSVADVCRSFGTTMEALREVLVCRREGNLLDNALLPMLLPAGVVDSFTAVTCISAQGRTVSAGCMDACCFGCSSDRERLVNPARQLQLEEYRSRPSQRASHRGRNLFLPLPNPLQSHSFQQMTSELLLSGAPCSTDTTPQHAQTLSPASATVSATASPDHHTPSPLSRLDASVDRLLAHHQRTPNTSPGVKAAPSNRIPLQIRLPFSPYELRRQKGKAALHAEAMLAEHVAEMERRADAAVQLARERTAEARRSETAALDKSCEVQAQLAEMRHRYAAEEAALLIQQKVLELACTELEGRERELTAAVAARAGVAEGLQRAERQMAELEPRVREMRAAEQLASHCAELQQRHAAYVDEVCGAYGSAVAAKLALLDSHAHALADGVRLDAWETRLTRLQQDCAAQEARVSALVALSRGGQRRVEELQSEESELRTTLDGLRGECARLEAGVARLDAEREEKQRRIAADLSEAAAAQDKALQDYDASIAVLRRLKGEQQDLRAKRDALREDCEKEKTLYVTAKKEAGDIRTVLNQLHITEKYRAALRERDLERHQKQITALNAQLDALRARADREEAQLRAAVEDYDAHMAAVAESEVVRVQVEERDSRRALRDVERVARSALTTRAGELHDLRAAEERECAVRAEAVARDAVLAAQAAEMQRLVAGLAARMADTAGCVAADVTAQQAELQAELERLQSERDAATCELADLAAQQARTQETLAGLGTDMEAALERLAVLRARADREEAQLRAAVEDYDAHMAAVAESEVVRVQVEERDSRRALRDVERVARSALTTRAGELHDLRAAEERECAVRAEAVARDAVLAAQAAEMQRLVAGLAARISDSVHVLVLDGSLRAMQPCASPIGVSDDGLYEGDGQTLASGDRRRRRELRGLEDEASGVENALRELRAHVEGTGVAEAALHDDLERLQQSWAALSRCLSELNSPLEVVSGTASYAASSTAAPLHADSRGESLAMMEGAATQEGKQAAVWSAQDEEHLEMVKGIIGDELRTLIEELADATEELAEVEDVMIAETDKALLAFRRCDGELTLRVERLMDRCASFIDVESRLLSRASSYVPRMSAHQRKSGLGSMKK